MPEPSPQTEVARAVALLSQATLVVRAVARNQYSKRLAKQNRLVLAQQAAVLREIATIIEAMEMPTNA